MGIITKLRERNSGHLPSRTTLIPGFPGETKEDHEELMEFVNRHGVRPPRASSTYSPEEGTPAAEMPGSD